MSFLTLQLQKLQLSGAGAISTATSIVLASMKLIDGTTDVTMTMFGGTIGYMTLEPSTSREEQISFSGIVQNSNGTATLTGVTRGLAFESPYAETSTNKKSHSGSVTCVVSNTSAFYSQFSALKNDNIFTGTNTETNFPIKSGTTTPTSAAQFATKSYVDSVVGGTAVYDQNIIQATAGEILAIGDAIYFKTSDQKWWKTNATASVSSLNVKVGIAQSSAAANASVNVLIGGLDKTQTAMTPGASQYLSDSAGVLVEIPGTFDRFVGYAVTATDLMLNIESVTVDEKNALVGTSGYTPSIDNKFVDNADTTVGATQTAITIAFVNSNPDTITDSGSGFITAGFKVGDSITVSGSASNNGTFIVATIVAGTITLVAGDTLVAEVAGASVTIIASIASKVLRLKSDGKLPVVDGSNLLNVPPATTVDIQTFTTPGVEVWTKPAGAKSVEVYAFGGGGGGGNPGNTAISGGGGSQYVYKKFQASGLGTTENILVGAGGAGGLGDMNNLHNGIGGGDSSFGTIVILKAVGGYGGHIMATASSGPFTTGGNGDIRQDGGAGAYYNGTFYQPPLDARIDISPRSGGYIQVGNGGYSGIKGAGFIINYIKAGGAGGAGTNNSNPGTGQDGVGDISKMIGGTGGGASGGSYYTIAVATATVGPGGKGGSPGGGGGAGGYLRLGTGGSIITPVIGGGGAGGDGAVVVITYT